MFKLMIWGYWTSGSAAPPVVPTTLLGRGIGVGMTRHVYTRPVTRTTRRF